MFKKVLFSCLIFVCCGMINSAVADEVSPKDLIFNRQMLNDHRYTFSVQRATFDEQYTKDTYPNAQIYPVDSYEDAIRAVSEEKADAFIMPSFLEYHTLKRFPNLSLIPGILRINKKIGITVFHSRPDLLKKVDHFTADLMVSGEFDQMYNRWLMKKSESLPKIKDPQNPTETITVAFEQNFYPMSFMNKKGKYVGFYVEFIKKFALYANVKVNMIFDTVDQVQEKMKKGEVQIFATNVKPTPERLTYMNFSVGFLDENFVVLVRKNRLANEQDLSVFDQKNIIAFPGHYFPMKALLSNAKMVKNFGEEYAYHSLEIGEVDGILMGYDLALNYVQNNPKYTLFPAQIGFDRYTFAVPKDQEKLRNHMSVLQKKYIREGFLQKEFKLWFGTEEALKVSPPMPKGKKSLRVGYVDQVAPFSFTDKNGFAQGIAVDLLYRLLNDLGYGISEMTPYDYKTIFEALEQGEIDIAIGDLSVTQMRGLKYGLLDPYYKTFNVIVVPKKFLNDMNSSWLRKLKKWF